MVYNTIAKKRSNMETVKIKESPEFQNFSFSQDKKQTSSFGQEEQSSVKDAQTLEKNLKNFKLDTQLFNSVEESVQMDKKIELERAVLETLQYRKNNNKLQVNELFEEDIIRKSLSTLLDLPQDLKMKLLGL